jgi:hypothetical protein
MSGNVSMATPLRILLLGASYGSLLASKLLLAGHTVRLVPSGRGGGDQRRGFCVRSDPRRGRVSGRAASLPGSLSAGGPQDVDPAGFDLVGLAMQEPQPCAGRA